jgi:hypothetical protein
MSNDTSLVERLIGNRRFQLGGLIAGALVLGASLAAANADVGPKQKRAPVVLAPEQSPNVALLRYWPYPSPKVEQARAESLRRGPGKATVAKRAGQRVITARR